MSTKQLTEGRSLTITASAAYSSGDVVEQDGFIGVAQTDIANGADGSIALTGVHICPKKTGQAWVMGDRLWYDSSAETVSNAFVGGSADRFIGRAWAAAGSADTTGSVMLGQSDSNDVAVLTSGQVAVTAATSGTVLVGAGYNGLVVRTYMLTSDANESVRSAAIAAGTLTVTLTGSATAKVWFEILDIAVA